MMENFAGISLFFLLSAALLSGFSQYWFKMSFLHLIRPGVFLLIFIAAAFSLEGFLFSAMLAGILFVVYFPKNIPENRFCLRLKKWAFPALLLFFAAGLPWFFFLRHSGMMKALMLTALIFYWLVQIQRISLKVYQNENDLLFLDLSMGLVFSGFAFRSAFPSQALDALTLSFLFVHLFALFFFMERKIRDLRTLNLKYREKLLHSEKEYLKIFENSPAMYLLLSPNFIVMDCNQKFLEAVGLSMDGVLTRPLEDFVPDLFKNKLRLLKNYLKFHKASSGEFALVNSQKKDTIDVFLSAMKEDENTFIIMQDITVIKWMQNSLASYAEQLKKEMEHAKIADRMKSVFLANMSHEIRTPLTSIIGFSALLKETGLTSVQADYVSKVTASGEHLLKIINDIIDLSKIEAGKMDIEMERVNLNRLFSELFDMVLPYFKNKPIEFRVVLENDFQERYVILDGFRLKQVMLNLVSNAVKFTERGKIEIRCFLESGQAVISVSDTGIGIAPEKQGVIFDAFVQAEESLHRVYGGTGLGLAISKRLVELMGGSIFLTSEVGKGTLIRVAFPDSILDENIPILVNEKIKEELAMKQKEQNRPEPPEPVIQEALEHPPTLLVAEDNESVFLLLDFVLRKNQVHMVRAKDGEEALSLYEQYRLSLKVLLLDINLPKIDGLSVAEKVKKENPHLRLIGFSGFSYEEVKSRAEGVLDDYIKKPFKINEIYNLLKDYL